MISNTPYDLAGKPCSGFIPRHKSKKGIYCGNCWNLSCIKKRQQIARENLKVTQKELFEDDYPVNNKIIENLEAEDEVMINLNELAETKDEKVNHPKHYNRDGAMEMIDELEVVFGKKSVILFCKMNAWKYRYRAGLKGGEDKTIDMAKSDWYLRKAKELQDGKAVQSE